MAFVYENVLQYINKLALPRVRHSIAHMPGHCMVGRHKQQPLKGLSGGLARHYSLGASQESDKIK